MIDRNAAWETLRLVRAELRECLYWAEQDKGKQGEESEELVYYDGKIDGLLEALGVIQDFDVDG